jgi:uncharacterized membrane protein YphA (DoxX/SURF4 family)
MMRRNVLLWILQVVLAALFLFAGGMKLVLPIEAMKGPVELPGLFLRFIGICEVLGAVGLIAPWATHIRPGLTPLAAVGLVVIMIGATTITGLWMSLAQAAFPAVVGVLALVVARARWSDDTRWRLA